MNHFSLPALALAGVLVAAPLPAVSQPYVVGDSHCLRIAQLMANAKWKITPKHGPKNGATIADLSWQLSRVPWGSDVVACAGTNNSNPASEEDVTPYVDAAIDVAMLRGLRVAWIGPAYITRTRWRLKAILLDDKLARLLITHRAMTYVSMQPSEHPADCLKDYTHLQDRCYRDLARKAAAAASF